jgi:two-component system phosphate regulon sensor histidine kinase PhoR
MNDKKYTWLLYLIVTTIVLTIAVQAYWNYKNYLLNKQYFTNQVQVSLDNALDTYYADLAESNEMTIIESDSIYINKEPHTINPDSILKNIELEYKNIHDNGISGFTELNDSNSGFTFKKGQEHISKIKVVRGKKASDSIKLLKGITSIFISIKNDSLDFSKLNPLVDKELKRKQLDIPFALKHFKDDSLFNSINVQKVDSSYLKAESKSTFLKYNETLIIAYPNATSIILKQGLVSILISTLLVFAIVGCLLYLLKIIQKQKQLAEVKNDLISNITHEFKTPIATIGVALESIKNFNVIDNKEKTKSYLDMSSNQLSKLNVMVEKLLETATLDSDNLELKREAYAINEILEAIVAKHKIQCENKTINFLGSSENVVANVDSFHFENAINNILDNAIKYGGDLINIELSQGAKDFYVSISDNGNTITKANTDKIFEKFYRIPKGNTHDVKGFGIGLYYTKKIIEKHNGTINLDLSKNLTTFKITLPND